VLELGGASLVNEPLSTRRCWLEKLVREHAHPCLQLMEQTSSIETAREWLRLLPTIEGVVAKRAESRYDTGRRRDWIKVKRHRTADCGVICVAGDLRTPKLVLGLRWRWKPPPPGRHPRASLRPDCADTSPVRSTRPAGRRHSITLATRRHSTMAVSAHRGCV
jgi:hypothetical protein